MHFSAYTLEDLITDYSYSQAAAFSNMHSLIDNLELPKLRSGRVTIIGINGPTCAGKTTFSERLVEQLKHNNIPCIGISFEWFLLDRKKRVALVDDVAKGKTRIQDVTSAAWDISKYTSLLSRLKDMRGSPNTEAPLHLTRLYDRESGAQMAQATLEVPYGGYIVVEGVSVLDIDDTRLVDCYIRLDVDDDSGLIDRIIKRERIKPPDKQLTEEFLKRRFDLMDKNHMRYLRKISYNHNRYIINTSNFNDMKVFTHSHATLS